jgi:hypothetical protein
MNKPILAAAVIALLPGCADTLHSSYSKPYVKFEAEHNQDLKGLFPATVVAVDGQRINAGDTPPFPPGMRTVDVEMRLQHDAYSPQRKSIQVDAKPCTRYYLASRKTPEGPFVPVVSHEEPIKECRAGPM